MYFRGSGAKEIFGYIERIFEIKDIRRYKLRVLWAQKIIDGKSGYLPVHINRERAALFMLIGEWNAAEAIYRRSIKWMEAISEKSLSADYRASLGELLRNKGRYSEAVSFLESALATYREAGDGSGICITTGNLGAVCWCQGEYDKARDHFLKKQALCRETGDIKQLATSYSDLGNVYFSRGENPKAKEHFREALKMFREIGYLGGVWKACCNLGTVHFALDELDEAMEYFQENLRTASLIGDRQGIAVAQGNIGNVHLKLGKHRQAIENYGQYYQISLDLGYRQGMAMASGNLGLCHKALGETALALECLTRDVDILEQIGYRQELATALDSLGMLLLETGDKDGARRMLDKAVIISTEIGDDESAASAYLDLAEWERRAGNQALSLKVANQALELAGRGGYGNLEAGYHHMCGKIFQDQGKPEQAEESFKLALTIAREIREQKLAAEIKISLAMLAVSRQDDCNAVRHLTEAGEIYGRLGLEIKAKEAEALILELKKQDPVDIVSAGDKI